LPGAHYYDGLGGMGAKYFPSIKDMKANLRFQQKQKTQPSTKKTTALPPAKSSAKK